MNKAKLNQDTPKRRVTQPVFISSKNYIPGSNLYSYTLPGSFNATDNNAKIGVAQYAIYNSSYNISESLGNNRLTITWIDGQVREVVFSDGYYSVGDINSRIQYELSKMKWYLVSTTQSNQLLYHINIAANTIKYAAEITILYVKNTEGFKLPDNCGWTLPSSDTIKYPMITLSRGFMKILGFKNQSSFPLNQTGSSEENLTYLSNTTPVLSDTFAYSLSCNMINSKFSLQHKIFFQIGLTKSFGELISESLPTVHLYSVYPGVYTSLEISIYDDEQNAITPLDPEFRIQLILEYDE